MSVSVTNVHLFTANVHYSQDNWPISVLSQCDGLSLSSHYHETGTIVTHFVDKETEAQGFKQLTQGNTANNW